MTASQDKEKSGESDTATLNPFKRPFEELLEQSLGHEETGTYADREKPQDMARNDAVVKRVQKKLMDVGLTCQVSLIEAVDRSVVFAKVRAKKSWFV